MERLGMRLGMGMRQLRQASRAAAAAAAMKDEASDVVRITPVQGVRAGKPDLELLRQMDDSEASAALAATRQSDLQALSGVVARAAADDVPSARRNGKATAPAVDNGAAVAAGRAQELAFLEQALEANGHPVKEAAASAADEAVEEVRDPLEAEQLELERIWRFDLGGEVDLGTAAERADALNSWREAQAVDAKGALHALLSSLWERHCEFVDQLTAARPELVPVVESSRKTGSVDMEFVQEELFSKVPTEDEVLCAITRERMGQVCALILTRATQGLQSTNNYNKTSAVNVVADPSSMGRFTLPVISEGTGMIYRPDKSEPEMFAALCRAYIKEQVQRKLSLTRPDGSAKSQPERLAESFVLQALCGRLRLTATAEAGVAQMEEYLHMMAHIEAAGEAGDAAAPALATPEQRTEFLQDLIQVAQEEYPKWPKEFCMAKLVLDEVAHMVDGELQALRSERAEEASKEQQQSGARTKKARRGGVKSASPDADVDDTPLPDYLLRVPQGIRDSVSFALSTRDLLTDKYIPTGRLVKSLAKGLKDSEVLHAVLQKNLHSARRDQIPTQPRHFKAAGSLIELMCSIRMDGYRPFSLENLRVTTARSDDQKALSVLRFDPYSLRGDVAAFQILTSDYPPMVVPPDSWGVPKPDPDGRPGVVMCSPYKTMHAKLLRPSSMAKWATHDVTRAIDPVLPATPLVKSLDYIASVKWRISEIAVDHLCWAKGVGLDLGDKLKGGWIPVPPPPPKHRTQKSVHAWWRECEQVKKKGYNRRSAVATSDKIVDLLHRFRGKTLHLPTNCDFRGRTYPMHTGLNYQASDFVRSSLEFGEKKPITEAGLKHMKIHTANLMGLDKASFTDRIAWVDNNIEKIIECRDNPRDPDALWRKADKPLLGYTMLCEVANAYSHSRGPAHYETGVPIHVDGSCNGLQHYSAIALDHKGAATANLTKKTYDEKPSDVYTAVLEYVKHHNLEVINAGGKQAAVAAAVHPMLKRKTVKQSVMTNVYGVTNMGMHDQIKSQLVAQAEEMLYPPSPNDIERMAGHVRKLVVLSLSDVFKGAIEVQAWFKESINVIRMAHKLSGINAPPLSVISPVGVPVTQPYFSTRRSQCTVQVGSSNIAIEYFSSDSDLAYGKQRTAFPPNYIHSMDASHVHLTCSMLAAETDITAFGCVHDSFWGHAADMDVVNDVLRKSFVELYSPNRLEMLYLDLSSAYGKALQRSGLSLPLPPQRGTFDLTEVLDAPYFFA